mgnify:CR=1 FL=1
MLKYVKGDLLSVTSGIIAHGVNCRGAFGSGVAGQIAKLYPSVRQFYLDKYNTDGWELGNVQFIFLNPSHLGNDITIANVASQDDYGTDKVNVDYSGLAIGLETVFRYAEKFNLSVALPKIGCGLAGGSWEVVERIITTLLMKYPISVTIYEYEGK